MSPGRLNILINQGWRLVTVFGETDEQIERRFAEHYPGFRKITLERGNDCERFLVQQRSVVLPFNTQGF